MPAGDGSAVATWSFQNVLPGQYEVFVTWEGGPDRATDAPFTILDGSMQLLAVDVNQEPEPIADSIAGMRPFQSFGEFTVTGDTLVVRLTNDANQFVVADAVRIVRVGDLPAPPAGGEPVREPAAAGPPALIVAVDDGDAAFGATGGWALVTGEGFGGDMRVAPAGAGEIAATWEFATLPGGVYAVYATWAPQADRASNAPYALFDSGSPLGSIRADQRQAPRSDYLFGGRSFQSLGVFTIGGDMLTIRLTNDADGAVVADAIVVERIGP
jgi:hypothetical protein